MASRFWFFARPYLPIYLLGFVLLLVTNGLSLWIPWLLRGAIHAMEAGTDLSVLTKFGLGMIGVALLQGVARTASRLALLGNSRKIVSDVRSAFFHQLQRLSASYYDTHRTGDIMSRAVNDIQILQGFYGPGIMNLTNTAIVYIAVLALLLKINVQLTLISMMLFPLLMLAVNRLSRRVYALSIAVQEQLSEISSRAQENISGIQQVKTYVQEDREIQGFAELCSEFRQRNLAMAAMRGSMLSLIGVVTGVGTLIVLFAGGRFVIEGRITFGDFVAFNAYLGLLVWPTIALGWIINTFQRGAGAMRRLEEVFQEQPDIPPAIDEVGVDERHLDLDLGGALEVRNLTFTYPGADRPTLHDVSVKFEPGTRVAIVGPVGSGKSTLANLLARVYPVPDGTIFLNGQDINTLPVSRLRKSLGYVPQEAFLFSRSLRDNVRFGRPDLSDDDVQAVVTAAHLRQDLAALPDGLDTVVGERGFTLSGGQRQRTTLARALALAPQIVILDDSLSSVDADTERAILAALDGQLEGRTSILISHRAAALADVDQILVLDEGRIVERGDHRQLLDQGGLYAKLFQQRQLEERLQ